MRGFVEAYRPMQELLPELFGLELRSSGDEWTCLCPLPEHDDHRPSFFVYADGQRAKCFGCGWSGDAVALLVALGMSQVDAVRAARSTQAADAFQIHVLAARKQGLTPEELDLCVSLWARRSHSKLGKEVVQQALLAYDTTGQVPVGAIEQRNYTRKRKDEHSNISTESKTR